MVCVRVKYLEIDGCNAVGAVSDFGNPRLSSSNVAQLLPHVPPQPTPTAIGIVVFKTKSKHLLFVCTQLSICNNTCNGNYKCNKQPTAKTFILVYN